MNYPATFLTPELSKQFIRLANLCYVHSREIDAPWMPFDPTAESAKRVKNGNPQRKREWVIHCEHLPPTTRHNEANFFNGAWSEERKQLHQALLERLHQKIHPVAASEKPVAIILIGIPGAGKNHVYKYLKEVDYFKTSLDNYLYLNLDNILVQLPEFEMSVNMGECDGRTVTALDAAQMCHDEASYLHALYRYSVVEERFNFVYDGTGSNVEYFSMMLSHLHVMGYVVQMIYVHATVDVALVRINARSEVEGRYVSSDIVYKIDSCLQRAREIYFQMIPSMALIENIENGVPPQLL